MKKIFFVVSVSLSLLFTSCLNINIPGLHKKDDSTEVVVEDSDGKQVLQRVKVEYLNKRSICVSQSDTTAGKQRAVEAIKYSLKMYKPDLQYYAIRAVAINDGTYDVIIDFRSQYTNDVEHTYYNVTLGEGDNFQINTMRGDLEGQWSLY